MAATTMRRLHNVYFELSGACNLLCKHCYVFKDGGNRARPDRLDAAVVGRVLDEAKALGATQATFTGGEILIRKDLAAILKAAAERVGSLYLLSNLTLLDDGHIELFRSLPVAMVSTSLDGLESQHDAMRGQKGAFGRSWANLNRLRDAGIRVKVSVTVTPENLGEARDLFSRLDGLGISSSIARVAPQGRGRTFMQERDASFDGEYTALLAERLALAVDPDDIVGMTAPGEELATHCGVGTSIIYVMSDGEVGWCPSMLPADDARWGLGNVFDTSLAEIWRPLGAAPEDPQCRQVSACEFGETCRGGCRANAFLATGDLEACDREMRAGFSRLKETTLAARAAVATPSPRYRVV